jgi:hypothetical protein
MDDLSLALDFSFSVSDLPGSGFVMRHWTLLDDEINSSGLSFNAWTDSLLCISSWRTHLAGPFLRFDSGQIRWTRPFDTFIWIQQ